LNKILSNNGLRFFMWRTIPGAAGVLTVLLLGGCGGQPEWEVRGSREAAQAVETALGPLATPQPSGPQEPVSVAAIGFDFGDPAARVAVVEFSDFGCGYCRRFHETTFPVLDQEFVSTGKVRWKYVPFSIGMFPNGAEAALAGECAGAQDRFLEMKGLLYERQSDWRGSRSPFDLFSQYAQELRLDGNRFQSCLLDPVVQERILANGRMASRLGVRGTPTFFVQGQPVQGAIPLELFREILTEMVQLQSGG